jgi:hypothetical protein
VNTRMVAALVAFAVLPACGRDDTAEESPIDAIDAPGVRGVPAVETAEVPPGGPGALPSITLATPAIDVPESVPRPAEYALVSEVPGPGIRITTVEVREDIRALAARFNQELAQSGADHQALREEQTDDGRFVATGHVSTPRGRVRIGVREHTPEDARGSDGTGVVTYGVPTGRS